MFDSPLDLVARDPHWRQLLSVYRERQRERREGETSRETWVRRLRTVDGVPDDQLSQIHGRLIAYGLLRFQLAGQGTATGLEYQVTPLGRRALGEAVSLDEAVETAAEIA